jgi:hypothetical protein
MPRSSFRKALAGAAGLALAFTAAVGVAHTRAGRPLLAWMGGGHAKGGCPFGYDAARTPEERAAALRQFATTHAGEARAAARPALGFTLDVTTRADVLAWAAARGVACRAPRSGPDLTCDDVPAEALPDARAGARLAGLWMTFGPRDELVSVTAVRRHPSAETIAAAFGDVTATVAREAGPPVSTEGDASAARLAAAPLRQASAEYRFRDYYALARATNMGSAFALTEEYRSLPE